MADFAAAMKGIAQGQIWQIEGLPDHWFEIEQFEGLMKDGWWEQDPHFDRHVLECFWSDKEIERTRYTPSIADIVYSEWTEISSLSLDNELTTEASQTSPGSAEQCSPDTPLSESPIGSQGQ